MGQFLGDSLNQWRFFAFFTDLDHFAGLHVVVLDDITPGVLAKLPEPTYALETSVENYQVGYALHPTVTDLSMAQRIHQALQSAGVAADNYNLAKAQCWVHAANTAQSENDRSGFAQQALGEAGQLLGALEADKNAAPRYGVPSKSSLRPDLAAKLQELQGQEHSYLR